jgi:molybdate transport system permease protein
LPIALYTLTQIPGGEDGAFRLVLISIGVAFAALLVSEIMARRLKVRLGT